MSVTPHATKLDARETFARAFDEVTVKEIPWMAAVWSVEDGRIVLNHVTTSEFPHGDMCAAVGHLGTRLHEIMMDERDGPKLPNDPLPKASDLGFRIAPTPDPDMETPKIEPVLDLGKQGESDEVADQ